MVSAAATHGSSVGEAILMVAQQAWKQYWGNNDLWTVWKRCNPWGDHSTWQCSVDKQQLLSSMTESDSLWW